ncbi:major facilitator superfamily MFS_1 [Thermodesulfobium narugense DSM 14796]|uniref:Major facilitator superfamily MFS_1 n=1 Tax=Thermodesulfobium narugense DSM 14796 TaxID=747365 RepID=M1E8D1_9BACT|nr:MFS transporter [Thermodesulfobium narugense]AEE15108.1 major facilitator superfamily MFS_1 [Thermodesulfobium narugense DSM 14796]
MNRVWLFEDKYFLRLWIAQIFSQFSDKFLMAALMIAVSNITSTNISVSSLMVSFALPSVIIAPFIGVFLDKVDRKIILVSINILRSLLSILLVFFLENLFAIYLYSFLIASLIVIFAPAEFAMIPKTASKKNLPAANSLFNVTWVMSFILGFAAISPVVLFFGIKVAVVLAAMSYLVAAVVSSILPNDRPHSEVKYCSFRKALFDSFTYIKSSKLIQVLILEQSVATSLMGMVSVLAVGYVREVLHLSEANFSIIVVPAGLGMVLGSLIIGHIKTPNFKNSTIVSIGILFASLCLVLMSIITQMLIIPIISFLLGISNALVNIPIQSMMQKVVKESFRGRVFAILNMFISFTSTFPILFTGELADMFGVRICFLILGILTSFLYFSMKSVALEADKIE